MYCQTFFCQLFFIASWRLEELYAWVPVSLGYLQCRIDFLGRFNVAQETVSILYEFSKAGQNSISTAFRWRFQQLFFGDENPYHQHLSHHSI